MASERWSLQQGEFVMGGEELAALERLISPHGYSATVVAQDGAAGWSGWCYWVTLDVPDDAPVAAEVRRLLRLPPRP